MFAWKIFFIIVGIAMLSQEILAGKDFFKCNRDKVCETVLNKVSPGYYKYLQHALGKDDKGNQVLGCKYKETKDSDEIWYDMGVGGNGENDVLSMNCCQVPTTGVCTSTGVNEGVLEGAC